MKLLNTLLGSLSLFRTSALEVDFAQVLSASKIQDGTSTIFFNKFSFDLEEMQNAILKNEAGDAYNESMPISLDADAKEDNSTLNLELQFKLFESFEHEGDEKCNQVTAVDVFGYYVDEDANKCKYYFKAPTVTAIKEDGSQEEESSDSAVKEDSSDNLVGLSLNYESVYSQCLNKETQENQHFYMVFTATCADTFAISTTPKHDECKVLVTASMPEACPKDNLEEISKKVDEVTKQVKQTLKSLGKWWGAVMIPSGLVLTLFGFKMIQFTFALLIFLSLAVGTFLLFVLVVFATSLSTPKLIFVALLSVAAGGSGAFYGTKHMTKFGIAVLASFGMISLSFLVVPLMGIQGFEHANFVKLFIYVLFGAAGFAGAAYFSDGIQVFVTAFIGAYLAVRGVSLFAGGFINEFDIAKSDDVELTPAFYGYIVGIFVLFFVGVTV